MRTRFAPSPTGVLHVGSARTALFAWLHARSCGGEVVLRIEDTDLTRSDARHVAQIHEALEWLGLDFDAEVPAQSTRDDAHRAYVQTLLDSGAAYRDSADRHEVETWRRAHENRGYRGTPCAEGAVRLRMPDEPIVVPDLIAGEVHFDGANINDPVIARADGRANFTLANCVDDHADGIDVVIRGDDHLSNTPKQIAILHALGLPVPAYAHLPLIVDARSAKLSKRSVDAETGEPLAITVADLRMAGLLPAAVLAYLTSLGSAAANDELLPLDEIVGRFDLTRVSRSPAKWNPVKLDHLNGLALRAMPTGDYARMLADVRGEDVDERYPSAVALVQPKAGTRSEAARIIAPLLGPPVSDGTGDRWLTRDGMQAHLRALAAAWEATDFTADALLASAREVVADREDVGLKALMQAARACVLGSATGVDLTGACALLGATETLTRLRAGIDSLEGAVDG